MLFSKLASFLAKLDKTASRIQMTEILADVFLKASVLEIDKVCYLSLGQLAPKYQKVEFNMAEKMMVKAIAKTLDLNNDKVQTSYKQMGDLGNVIYFFKAKQKKPKKSKLTVIDVYQKLLTIAQEEGSGSVERKINKMTVLLKELDPLSAKYIGRIPVNKLRLGFSDMTILDSLSWMKTKDKSLRPKLERAFNVLADIGKIAKTFKAKGLIGINQIKTEVGIPIRAAKAERLPTAKKILEKMNGKCGLEPKMDGFRTMIHLDKAKKIKLKDKTNLSLFEDKDQCLVRIFSRNLDNMTHMFPEIVEAVQELEVDNVILDGEAIAFDKNSGKFLPFQETVQRKRKHGIAKKAKEVPLKVFVFDILHLNGKTLLKLPFSQRRKILETVLKLNKTEDKTIILTQQKIVTKAKDFETFFQKTVTDGLEGLMAKKLDASYQAGARNFNWVKYKVGMRSELADTIDCVVMGYYQGKGKRTSFGIGAFLVGIYDKKNQQFLTTSKIGTGLTDQQWKEMFKRCSLLKTKIKPKEYQLNKNLNPDVWVSPKLVVEIEADTITKSPIHTAKLALRFPRLKKIRDDKTPDQATTLKELKHLASLK